MGRWKRRIEKRHWRAAYTVPGLLAVMLSLNSACAENDHTTTFGTAGGVPAVEQTPEDKAKAAQVEDSMLDGLLSRHVLVSLDALQSMQAAIDHYQQIVAHGGWPALPRSAVLRPGDRDEAVIAIRAQLIITDGLSPEDAGNWVFDEALEASLKHFQARHGIPPTGAADRRTLAALSIPATQRLNQLRLNLQRMRDMLAEPLPPRFVLVNVPGFELQAVANGHVELGSRVIVGRTERPTPTVTAKIKGLNFFPFWNVPESVAHLDLIPKLSKDPEYLNRERIRVLTDWKGTEVDSHVIDWHAPEAQTLRFRQDPGPQNALGLVRVDMPNEHNVYMHDTPMKQLFGRADRAFSAGCVRVHRIFDLVSWIAATNGDWDRARVDSVLSGGFAEDVKLTNPIDVYFVYLTAWTTPEGIVEFRGDLYDRDGAADPTAHDDKDSGAAPLFGQQALAP